MYIIEQEKRNPCSPTCLIAVQIITPTHNTEFGHRDLNAKENLLADLPEPGMELIIRHRKE